MKKRYNISRLLIMIAGLSITSLSTAQAEKVDWYQVEVIVFRYNNTANAVSEVWPQNPGQPFSLEMLELIDKQQNPKSTTIDSDSPNPAVSISYLSLLNKDVLQLNDAWTSIKKSRDRTPILHYGWRQPVSEMEQAVPVHIQGGQWIRQTRTFNQDSSDTFETQPSYGPDGSETVRNSVQYSTGPSLPQIDGLVRLSRGRYLHLEVDLLYRILIPSTSYPSEFVDEHVVAEFRLNQKRRMRSKELHYFDHPLFGVLARVIPYTPPEPKAKENSTSATTTQ